MAASKATFGKVIRARRAKIGLTQQQVADRIGASAPYVGHLEAGKRHPSDETVTQLAAALGVERREMFFLANPQTREMFHPVGSGKPVSAWEEFCRDTRLHRLHAITEKEMAMLSRIALMGDVRSPRDFIFVLNTVRHSLIH